MPLTDPDATFLGQPLAPYLDSLGSSLQSALTAGENTTLWTWKTFPVYELTRECDGGGHEFRIFVRSQ